MEIRICNFVFEVFEDPQDFLIDRDGTVYDRQTLEVNQQCEVVYGSEKADEFNKYFTSSNGTDVDECVRVSTEEWRSLYSSLSGSITYKEKK